MHPTPTVRFADNLMFLSKAPLPCPAKVWDLFARLHIIGAALDRVTPVTARTANLNMVAAIETRAMRHKTARQHRLSAICERTRHDRSRKRYRRPYPYG